jgi:hypothetical protein
MTTRTAISVSAAALALCFAARARADQFILIDATFDYTWDDAMNAKPDKSHYYVNEGNFLNKNRPTNWQSPVDYRNGTLHVRAEVFKKPPGTQTTGWTLCYIPNAGGYGCADTDYYTSTGVFERETKMTAWWNNDQLQWDKGIKQVDLIYAINDSGMGHITNYPALKDLTTPTRVRITMVQVSAGAKYDPSIITPSSDAGISVDAGDASWGSWEAGAPDAWGGMGGFGGFGGSATMGGMAGLSGVGGSGGASGGSSGMPPVSDASTNPGTTSGGSAGTTVGAGGAASTATGGAGRGGADTAGGCACSVRASDRRYGPLVGGIAFALFGWTRRRRRLPRC